MNGGPQKLPVGVRRALGEIGRKPSGSRRGVERERIVWKATECASKSLHSLHTKEQQEMVTGVADSPYRSRCGAASEHISSSIHQSREGSRRAVRVSMDCIFSPDWLRDGELEPMLNEADRLVGRLGALSETGAILTIIQFGGEKGLCNCCRCKQNTNFSWERAATRRDALSSDHASGACMRVED